MTHKNQTKKTGLKPKKDDTEGSCNPSMTHKEKMIEASRNSVNLAECLSRNIPITTKKLCSLQIQRQIAINDNYDMTQNQMYVNFLTEEELDEKIKRVLEGRRLLDYQRRKIRRFFQHIKKTGWFRRFTYRGYKCAVEFDELGRWRIFFQPKKEDYPNELHLHQCDCSNCGFHDYNSSRFGVEGFPLGLWDYGDKVGLDDFIGLPTFSDVEWEFDYFCYAKRYRDRNFIYKIANRLVDITYAMNMNKKLVDCWIKYQEVHKNDSPM